MNQKDARTYFDEWLTAYCDHLHIVRQGTGLDFVQPKDPKLPLAASAEKSGDATPQRKTSA